jgi:hypothetical protein
MVGTELRLPVSRLSELGEHALRLQRLEAEVAGAREVGVGAAETRSPGAKSVSVQSPGTQNTSLDLPVKEKKTTAEGKKKTHLHYQFQPLPISFRTHQYTYSTRRSHLRPIDLLKKKLQQV